MGHYSRIITAVALATITTIPPVAAQPTAANVVAFQDQAQKLGAQLGGVIGLAAWRLDGTGPTLLVNADQPFPMASTFKIAVAGRILERVDKGELKLDQMLDVKPEVMVPSEVLADRFIHPGVSLSVHNLLELMLTQSDNTATDVLTTAAGGPRAVTAWLRAQGVTGQRVDRDTADLLRDFYDLPGGPVGKALASFDDQSAVLAKSSKPNPAFDDDPRDNSTPQAMAALLSRIFQGKALSPASTKVLTEIMARCRTGDQRLKGLLPDGTPVAHKTGTIGGTVNDVGVITLPGGRGDIVVAAFVKKSAAPFAQRERAIAEVTRSAYDFFLFAVPADAQAKAARGSTIK